MRCASAARCGQRPRSSRWRSSPSLSALEPSTRAPDDDPGPGAARPGPHYSEGSASGHRRRVQPPRRRRRRPPRLPLGCRLRPWTRRRPRLWRRLGRLRFRRPRARFSCPVRCSSCPLRHRRAPAPSEGISMADSSPAAPGPAADVKIGAIAIVVKISAVSTVLCCNGIQNITSDHILLPLD